MSPTKYGRIRLLVLAVLGATYAAADPLPYATNCSVVQVPAAFQYPPFDVVRFLCVPPGFGISVVARVPGARFLTLTPDGNLLVSQPWEGNILLLQPVGDGTYWSSVFATGLYRPHDMVFHSTGVQMYLYIAEANAIDRFPWNPGDQVAHDEQILISGLPSASSPELQGAYAHELKNIVVDSDDNIYVSIASATNADPADRFADPIRGSIYVYAPDGSAGRPFAVGLRNAEGVRFVPGTNLLWAAVNQRDNIGYPYDDGSGNYGLVVQWYVNDHPPNELTFVRDGGDYGWPFANPNPDTSTGLDNMPFDADVQTNPGGIYYDPGSFDHINKGIPAHSAPLGLTFLQNTTFPANFTTGVLIALHGSWNRDPPTGYKVVYFPWNTDTQTPGFQQDFVAGWLDDNTGTAWGRPVATAVDFAGNVLISDDASGTIYQVTYYGSPLASVQKAARR